MEALLQACHEALRSKFGQEAEAAAFSPGRVNLIGEHIDYNGGHVFPCALSLGTYGVASKRSDKRLRFYSLNFKGIGVVDIDLEQLSYDPRHHWCNYPKAMIWVLGQHGYKVDCGLNLVINGNIPAASGLSSSASVEVLMAVLLRELFGFTYDNKSIALLAQEAENKFIGVNCGIMDQFAVAMGRAGQAMLLDTASLACQYAPLDLAAHVLLIASSNKKRGLGNSAYNERRAACELALQQLQSYRPELKFLCELSPAEFEAEQDRITDPVVRQRARHAVGEEQRTQRAYAALCAQDLREFGRLMYQSHLSLRDDYAVSCKELDVLVEASMAESACLGSRMTGAGFGGCTVSLLRAEQSADFIARVGASYKRSIGYAADFYLVKAGAGAGASPV